MSVVAFFLFENLLPAPHALSAGNAGCFRFFPAGRFQRPEAGASGYQPSILCVRKEA